MVAAAVRPALSLHEAVPYVAGAYLVFLAVIVIYVAIMAHKQRRLCEAMRELADKIRADESTKAPRGEPHEIEHASTER